MSDKPKQTGERTGKRIDVTQESECRYWSTYFGVTPEELKKVVRQVGPMVTDVRQCLRSRTGGPEST